MPNFTTEELLLYMYNELSAEETLVIETCMNNDWALHQKYQVLIEAKERMNKAKLVAPKQQSIDVIMKYAKSHTSVCN